ncbi:MAG: NAD-dependent epimerase/dehydratase family protein [Anaerolineae bacterium]
MTETVLVTGGAGFIGRHLVQKNLELGHEVTVFELPGAPGLAELARQGVRVVEGDIRDAEAVQRACRGQDVIFHCAAVVTDWAPRRLFDEVNVGGMENVCRAAVEAGVSRLVEMSTNDVFGLREGVVIDETFPYQPWGEPYPDTKLQATEIAWKYYREHGLPVTMVYPCWAYGPGDRTFVPLTADAIVKRELIFWRKDVIVWPTYIANLVDLLILISEHEAAVGEGFLVHDGVSDTFQGFCDKIADSLGVPRITTHIPYGAALAAATVMEWIWRLLRRRMRPLLTTYTVKNLGSRLQFPIAKAERLLGWKPPIAYEQGFAETMAWLKQTDPSTWKGK